MKTMKTMLLVLAAAFFLQACDQDGPLEEAGEDVDEAIEETCEDIKDAADAEDRDC
jgi:predicted small lipoprotein YifL